MYLYVRKNLTDVKSVFSCFGRLDNTLFIVFDKFLLIIRFYFSIKVLNVTSYKNILNNTGTMNASIKAADIRSGKTIIRK